MKIRMGRDEVLFLETEHGFIAVSFRSAGLTRFASTRILHFGRDGRRDDRGQRQFPAK